jgi:hypothetical protein
VSTSGQQVGKKDTPTFAGLNLTGTSGVLKSAAGSVSGSATTGDLPEGANLYFTQARVLTSPMTGFTAGPNSAVTASDTVLSATQKLQGQINNSNLSSILNALIFG